MRFADRTVYVTGAGSGLGRATARLFAAEGARVFAVDVNRDGVRDTITGIRDAGGAAEGGACDVAVMSSVARSLGDCLAAFGGLHILVNAAGVGGARRFEEIDEEEWQRVIAVNLTGAFHTTKAALGALLAHPGVANIVNVSSIAGLRGNAYMAHYSASKAGLLNFTRTIAVEFASRGLRANCVCPGGIKSPMVRNFTPRPDFEMNLVAYYSPPVPHVLATPEEMAVVIAFLASDDAKFINGVALPVDSGTLA